MPLQHLGEAKGSAHERRNQDRQGQDAEHDLRLAWRELSTLPGRLGKADDRVSGQSRAANAEVENIPAFPVRESHDEEEQREREEKGPGAAVVAMSGGLDRPDYRQGAQREDGKWNGGNTADKFRIKIWEQTSGGAVVRVIFDNQWGAASTAGEPGITPFVDLTTTLTSGDITLHKVNAAMATGVGDNPNAVPLTSQYLGPIVRQAIANWSAAGISAQQADLLRHTSGLVSQSDAVLGDAYTRLGLLTSASSGTLAEMIEKLGTLPLKCDPGAQFNYGI